MTRSEPGTTRTLLYQGRTGDAVACEIRAPETTLRNPTLEGFSLETVQPGEEARVRELVAEWSAAYPLFGAGSAAGLYTCSAWEAERTPLPERDAEGSAPILVIGNAGDPVTPLGGAVDLAEELDSGVLITWEGQGHTAYPKTDCVTAAVNSYLIDLAVPVDALTCPA